MYKDGMTNERRDAIADDLLQKYPAGPKGSLTRHSYSHEQEWCYDRRDYITKIISPVPNFGYDDETIVRLHHAMEESVSYYVRARWPDIGKRAKTRRANRLEERIHKPARSWSYGTTGRAIYSVNGSDYSTKLYVIANSENTAEFLAKTVLAGAGVSQETGSVSKVYPPDLKALAFYNETAVVKAGQSLKSLHERIETTQAKINNVLAFSEMLTNFGTHQHDILSSEEDE
jgi:hypothetical protein